MQRAVIAMAIAGGPKLILADEPTTALDVTIQDQILALLMDLQEATGTTLILVSHDMAVVAETCDRVAVMYAGRIMELAPTAEIFSSPRHPYTLGLLRSIPRIDGKDQRLEPIPGQPPNLSSLPPGCPFMPRCRFASPECGAAEIVLREVAPGHFSACIKAERDLRECVLMRSAGEPLLSVRDLVVEFPRRRSFADVLSRKPAAVARAVDGVSLDVYPNETVGLVGESGSGKTTLGRAILGLYKPASGNVLFSGQDTAASDPAARQNLHRGLQMVFQNPYSSLNPRMTVAQTIGEALRFHNMVPARGHPDRDRPAAWLGRART